MNSKLSLIAIIGKNRELGKDNKLIFNIPDDLKRFRKITANHPIIMGRKTFESIGHPLPNRTNIIISNNADFHAEGTVVVGTIDDAIKQAQTAPGHEELFIVGGGTIYTQSIGLADRLYLTVVDADADADTFFPDYSDFKTVISNEPHEDNGYKYAYLTLER